MNAVIIAEVVTTEPATTDPLIQAGYTQAAPPWLDPRNEAIDRKACSRLRCVCGKRGLTYTPYFRLFPQSYRVRARCEACGHVETI